MPKLTKKDIVSGLITGLTTGLAIWRISVFLGTPAIAGIPVVAFVFIVPVCWLAGVWFGKFMGQWIGFFTAFGRFVAIGFTNGAVDFSVLYTLIAFTGYDRGIYYTVYKSISFLVSMIHSYFWNKNWAFEATQSGGGGEFLRFVSVALVSFVVNVAVASAVVNLVGPLGGITTQGWAGIGAAAGSAAGLIFSFVGFKLVVFKK